jgi:hypothetical protein
MLWHIIHQIGFFVGGWFLVDALRGLARLGTSAERIAQSLEDLYDVLTEEAEPADEVEEETAPTTVVVSGEDPDEFVRALVEKFRRTPPPIPEDAR